MTARQFLEKYPDLPVDISEFIEEHGLDAEMPPIDFDDETTTTNSVYHPRSQEENKNSD